MFAPLKKTSWEKGETAGYQHVLLFPTMLSKSRLFEGRSNAEMLCKDSIGLKIVHITENRFFAVLRFIANYAKIFDLAWKIHSCEVETICI